MTVASGAPAALVKLYRPAMKSAVLMSWVLATRPATSRLAPGANRMPFGLIRNTWPLAVMLPKMLEGLEPITRFSTMAELFGWMYCTYWSAPTENCCQLMAAFWLVWLMTVALAFGVLMVAEPPTTCPPVGLASAIRGDNAPRPAAARAKIGFSRPLS